MTTPI